MIHQVAAPHPSHALSGDSIWSRTHRPRFFTIPLMAPVRPAPERTAPALFALTPRPDQNFVDLDALGLVVRAPPACCPRQ